MDSICSLKEIYKSLYNFEHKFQDKYGMTINEAMVLCYLFNGDKKTAGDICEYIGLSASRVSKVINSVEKMGYINRNISVEDKRQMIFSLTATGVRRITEMKSSEFNIDELYALLKNSIDV